LKAVIIFVQYKQWSNKNAIDFFVFFSFILVIFKTNFYRSKVENYLKIQNLKHTVFNLEKFVVEVWE
jgi:hypothetical protein